MSKQVDLGTTEPVVYTNVDKLDAISERILNRDRTLLQNVCVFWFQNGCDLIEAKSVIGHGRFETWCKDTLNYSKSKAEKLMRTAELFKPWLETVTVTDFPPPTLLYQLSAASTPQIIREEYLPRVIAKEKGVGTKLKEAIKYHREEMKRAEKCSAAAPEPLAGKGICETVEARSEVRETGKIPIDSKRQAVARTAALALISARVADDLPALIAFAVEAGPGSIFGLSAENELQSLARMQADRSGLQEKTVHAEDETVKNAESSTTDEYPAVKVLQANKAHTKTHHIPNVSCRYVGVVATRLGSSKL